MRILNHVRGSGRRWGCVRPLWVLALSAMLLLSACRRAAKPVPVVGGAEAQASAETGSAGEDTAASSPLSDGSGNVLPVDGNSQSPHDSDSGQTSGETGQSQNEPAGGSGQSQNEPTGGSGQSPEGNEPSDGSTRGDRPVEPSPGTEPSPDMETYTDGENTIYRCSNVEIPVPSAFPELLDISVCTPSEDGQTLTLFSCRERASVEAGERIHPGEDWGDGWLFSIVRVDQTRFEEWLTSDASGLQLFAKDSEGNYYFQLTPTDVRLMREDGEYESAAGQWAALNQWASGIPSDILARSPTLSPYDGSDLFNRDYTYEGAHRIVAYQDRDNPDMEGVWYLLSQPVRQGEGGLWCVDRIQYRYTDGHTYTVLNFPARSGVNMAAAEYYAKLQAECDAGKHPELLDPMGAALDFARSYGWFPDGANREDFTLLSEEVPTDSDTSL